MHQPPEDYIPPVGTQLAGMAIGFGIVWMVGSGMADSGFLGFLAGCIVGAPGGWVASYVFHYISLAPLREDDRRRCEEYKVKAAERAREQRRQREQREERERELWERIHRKADWHKERRIARGEMDDRLARYLKEKAEEAARKAEAL